QHQTRIGDMTVGELRRKLPLLQTRANALSGFMPLSNYLINRVSNEVARASRHLQQAEWLHNAERERAFSEKMQHLRTSADRHWNTEITDSIYYSMVPYYMMANKSEDALSVTNRIRNQQLIAGALEQIALQLTVDNSSEEVLNRFTSLLDYVDPTEYLSLTALLTEFLFTSEDHDRARSLAESLPEISSPQQQNEYLHKLMRLHALFAAEGLYETSSNLLNRMKALDETTYHFAFRDHVISLSKNGDHAQSVSLLDSLHTDYFRHSAISGIAMAMAEQGWVSDALTLMEQIPDSISDKTIAHVNIACTLYDFHDFERGDSLLEASLPWIREIPSRMERTRILIQVSKMNRRIDRPMSVVADFLEQAEASLDGITNADSFNLLAVSIIEQWLIIGRPDRARTLAEKMRPSGSQYSDQINGLMAQSVEQEYDSLARALAIMDEQRQHLHLYALSQLYLKQSNTTKATELSYTIRNFYWRSLALADLTVHLMSKGDSTEVGKAATDTLLMIQRIRDPEVKEKALEYASSRFGTAGLDMSDENRSIAAEMLSEL
ncbi:hypothetical protein QLX67_01120, partial [Balneolaceae bacterium ANBcel3]|nr:hypothetical protein [Balneolaceae bacterium ANBcel3]